ncbi:myelin-associated glycoprotein-like [Oncorhynchus kisutch]|uniref:myelin-associated glycoprotein-like n=1 Tax=Oncorhynchus kisutch TaxID=8019 RepID=UPI0012DEDF06|nr:myelin-associated glycoprotein-like [Oncorhynchus kisutch]
MPEKLDVLSGSCVQIPCAFDVPQDCSTFNSTVITSGVWIKESPYFGGRLNIVIFNSSKTYNTYQGKITGNMSWKNCTTVFFNVTSSYTNSYFFRIESRPFSATDPEKSVLIVVRDLPLRPMITVSGEMKEERPVSLNCSAAAPCPKHSPKLTWTLTPENQLQENSDQTKSVLSTVTFTASHLHHEKNITCTAVYPVGTSNKTAEHTMTLNVLFSPKNTSASLSPADPVSVGSCVNLTCSSTANPPVTNFTWFQICGGKPTQVASGQTYTINVTVGDGGMYYCEARNDHGIEKSMKVLLAIEVGMVYTNQAMTGEEPEEPAEDQPEEIHYGEIDFSKLQPKETPAVALDREQGQESEYAEVSVTGRGAQEPPVKTTSGSVSVPRDG